MAFSCSPLPPLKIYVLLPSLYFAKERLKGKVGGGPLSLLRLVTFPNWIVITDSSVFRNRNHLFAADMYICNLSVA